MPLEMSSLLGRRVEIHGLTSPQGQLLNGQVGGVTVELEAGRMGVRLKDGVKSIHKSRLRVRTLQRDEMMDHLMCPQVKNWPAEVVAFYRAQQDEHDNGADPEDIALRMHQDFEHEITHVQCRRRFFHQHRRFSTYYILLEYPEWAFCSLLEFGFSLDGMLKVVLRRLAGMGSLDLNALSKDIMTDCLMESHELKTLLRVAQAAGREADLVGSFDSSDLLRAVWAA
mmetsp:Transcript_65302/g.142251  ORF Transcript_65302/g.142251 Transcript_65302/m.142251 type:complete len:226 (-) Transcript_65302:1657-2334(-)